MSQIKKIKNLVKLDNNWISGEYEGFVFEAKVFDKPSVFGIDNGRVSKLFVTQNNKLVFNYDRGMDIDAPIGHEIKNQIEKQI